MREEMIGLSFGDVVSYGIGYVFAVVVGHFLIKMNVDALWRGFGVLREQRKPWHPAFLGLLERAMYTASISLGQASFIPLWLGLKVLPQWKRWGDDVEVGTEKIEGRAVFNVFLIGNALSVIFAGVGAESIRWLSHAQFSKTVFVYAIVVISTIASTVISCRTCDK
jgi:hypothetical protein